MNPRLPKPKGTLTPATIVGVTAMLATIGFACIGMPGDPGSDPCEWEKPEIPHSESTTPYPVLSSSKVASGQPVPADRELNDSGLNLMVENASISGSRFGFSGYQAVPAGQPAKVYLQHLDTLSVTERETEEDGTTHVCGTYTQTVKTVIDPAAGTQKVIIDRVAPFDQIVTSVISMTGRKSADGDIVRTEALSTEHTVADLKARVENHNPFNGTFPHSLKSGYNYSLNTPETLLSVSMCRFKWKWGADVTSEQRHYPPVCIVRFKPADDPATPADESLNLEIVDTIYWSGWKTQSESQVHEINPFKYKGHANGTYLIGTESLSFSSAPQVLAVNSDFDEGRIDSATGYAIPDCDDMPGVDPQTGSGNTQLQLDAVRNHLDGAYTTGADVTADLSPTWFGVSPDSFDDEFWEGASVKISKVNKTDPDTNQPESGQVRFYAVWDGGYYGIKPYDLQSNQAVNLVSGGVNGNGSSVYGSGSTIPENATFYMEGVRPGKITLECHIKRGALDEKFEQTFLVATEQSSGAWREEVAYQIRLQTKVATGTAVDIRPYNPSLGFYTDTYDQTPQVRAIYYYYRQLFQQMPEKLMWAGMAKVAAAPIYAGMSDLTEWYHASEITPGTGFLTRDPGTKAFIDNLLLSGQKRICTDMGWAHRAYLASGIWAIRKTVDMEVSADVTNLDAWEMIDEGIRQGNQSKINSGNKELLQREQRDVVQQDYNSISTLRLRQPPAFLTWWVGGVTVATGPDGLADAKEWLSANSKKSPLNKTSPHAPAFRAAVPGGMLNDYAHRWTWTSNPTNGMLEMWAGTSTAGPNLNATTRMSHNNQSMRDAASLYTNSNTSMLPDD